MIEKILMSFKRGVSYVKTHPQLLMTVVIACVVPITFYVSGQQFLDVSRDNAEGLIGERIGLMHDVFISLMGAVSYDSERMQQEITHISSLNSDISDFVIVKQDGTYLRVVSGLKIDQIGTFIENPKEYLKANIDQTRSASNFIVKDGTRYVESYRYVSAVNGDEYYIHTETSLAGIDAKFGKRVVVAYYWLVGLILFVMFLLYRHIRLIDYAALYSESVRESQMKDTFINLVAHELRAPLTAMRGYASMILERKDATQESREYARRIEESAERLVYIVNDLLDVARIHSGKLAMNPSDVHIQKVITSVLETMQSIANEKNISLKQETPPSDIVLFVDEKRLTQALTNLVNNSVKYTRAGNISISLEEKDTVIELRVKDTGTGISADNQKNLFAPFFRVASASVDHTIGTGLGMWITKQLIELMGGSINVESIQGVGTHVVVHFPKVTFVKEAKPSK